MSRISVRVLGCGDAFGSGGRFQTSFHLSAGGQAFLLDCGATTLVALQQAGLDPGAIDGIVLSHLHGDHFGGVPFLLLHAHYVLKRAAPLTIVGPPGTGARLRTVLEAMFPGSASLPWSYPLELRDLTPGGTQTIGSLEVASFPVDHPSGAAAFALRLHLAGKVIGFSGDTAWTDHLIPVADGADLFICECYSYQGNGQHHLNWLTLNRHVAELRARRILLTHMSQAMLDRLPGLAPGRFEFAEDGRLLEL
jgi:ribonuclease BN (tRNA processing enzyme)